MDRFAVTDPVEIRAGFYKTRMVRRGPFVAARIGHERRPERPEIWHAEVNGKVVGTPGPNMHTEEIERIMLFGEPITEQEYRFLLADSQWAAKNAPDDPAANPHREIDFNKISPEF